MSDKAKQPTHDRWARFRFAVVGPLLAAPPQQRGDLKQELEQLADQTWEHPITGEPTKLTVPTIERWYYMAKNAGDDPVACLRRQIRKDSGEQRSLSSAVREVLVSQYREHPTWSYQLHADNLGARIERKPELGPKRSYSTIRRFMKRRGLLKQRRRKKQTAGAKRAEKRFQKREQRSFEASHVQGLWHLDYHHARRTILTSDGQYVTPILLAVLDDYSRLCCHAQWYLTETAENLVHGLSQAIQKRGLPRALMSDNGAPMVAVETEEGLARLGIIHETTLPYSPEQNAKQEVFWAPVEGRLMAMLEGVSDLTLATLNEATLAWVEMEYHREPHGETGQPPLTRFAQGPSVSRESPSSDALRLAFARQVTRAQRKSDGTFTLDGVRFETPSRYRHLERLTVRYAAWDLSYVHLVEPRRSTVLCRVYPLDKTKNADGARRSLETVDHEATPSTSTDSGIAPLLENLMEQYASSGLPPAYLPRDEKPAPESSEETQS
jgi:transposase InsO family protein